jgi:hypothetical protein
MFQHIALVGPGVWERLSDAPPRPRTCECIRIPYLTAHSQLRRQIGHLGAAQVPGGRAAHAPVPSPEPIHRACRFFMIRTETLTEIPLRFDSFYIRFLS